MASSNTNTSPTYEEIQVENPQGQMEKRVDTVDYRSSAGGGQELKPVQVIHQPHSPTRDSGGVLAAAAAAVSSNLQSAKEALPGK